MNPTTYLQTFHNEPWFIRADVHESFSQSLREFNSNSAIDFAMSAPGVSGAAEIPGVEISGGFAFVPVSGIIDRNAPHWLVHYGFATSLRMLEAALFALSMRADVHTVIFIMNTPGGRAAGVPECASLIEEMRSSKRLVAWVDIQCTSAGMYLAAPCHEVVAMPSASVGSVSTIMSLTDTSEAYKMNGLERIVFTDGNLKATGMDGMSLTPVQTAHLESRLFEVGEPFKAFIERHRPAVSRADMEGGIYSGMNALEAGFVDRFENSLPDLLGTLIDSQGRI